MQLEITDIIFLPAVFFIGAVSAYEDYFTGKIRNKWIVWGFFYALIALAGLFLWSVFAEFIAAKLMAEVPVVPYAYFFKVFLNSLIALLLGFLLWKFDFMAAGDAKLFFVFSLLIPLKYYWRSYLPYFPSLVLLINIFMPIFFWILLRSVFDFFSKLKSRSKTEDFKKIAAGMAPRLRKSLNSFFKLFFVFIFAYVLLLNLRQLAEPWFFAYLSNEIIIFFIFFFSYRYINAYLKQNNIALAICLAALAVYALNGLLFNPDLILSQLAGAVKLAFVFLLIIQVIQFFTAKYVAKKSVVEINAQEIKAGARLVDVNFTYGNEKISKELNEEHIKILQTWANEKDIKKIKIHQKFPFAVWMFLGVIITLVLQKSILSILAVLFKAI